MTSTILFDKNNLKLEAFPTNKESSQTILLLTMNRGENRFSEEFVSTFSKIMDLIDSPSISQSKDYVNPILMITGSGKFFSNGLDLGAIAQRRSIMNDILLMLSRLLTLGMPTIAAINGHGFGAGLFLALCCDWRIMRKDRGYLCFPEADLKMPFSWGFATIVRDKVNDKNTLREASLLSKRYNAQNALNSGLVDRVSNNLDELLPDCKNFANTTFRKKKFGREKYSQMKKELYINSYLALKNYQANDSMKYINQKTSKL